MYLIFDTETSGLPRNFSAPISDLENWPKILWLGFVLLNENLEIIRKGNYYINPEELILINVTKITGISDEIAEKYGNSIFEILTVFKDVARKAKFLVGHNLDYDYKVLSAEIKRNNFDFTLTRKKRICLMKGSKKYVNKKDTEGELTFPRLSELFEKLYQENYDMKNSNDDIEYAMKCFIKLKEKKVI